MAPLEKATNQSDHFPHIPGKITWSPYMIINGESQTLLLRFFLRGGGSCTQATHKRAKLILSVLKSVYVPAAETCICL